MSITTIASAFVLLGSGVTADVTTVGDNVQLSPPGAGFNSSAELQRNRHVGAAADGSFVVVWDGFNNGDDPYNFYNSIWARRFDDAGSPLTDRIRVNAHTTGTQVKPAVASRSDGSFIVVWQSSKDLTINGNEVQSRMFDASGVPTVDELQVNTHTTDFQGEPSVDVFDDGGFIVVWTSSVFGQATDISGRRFDSEGAPLGDEFAVNSYTTLAQGQPNVSTSETGFVVVWSGLDIDDSARGVVARRFDKAADALGNDFVVNSYTTFDQDYPDVSAADDGSFVVVWVSDPQDGDDEGVFAQRFDASGTADGTEIQVSMTTSGSQRQPSVHSDADGFLVAWTDEPDLPSPADPIETMVRCYDDTGASATNEIAISEAQNCGSCGTGITRGGIGEYIVVWVGTPDTQFGTAVRGQRLSTGATANVCGDPLDPSLGIGKLTTASDALFALKAAIGSETCLACVCDVDDSGAVTATDALVILQAAVGAPVVLNCPAC